MNRSLSDAEPFRSIILIHCKLLLEKVCKNLLQSSRCVVFKKSGISDFEYNRFNLTSKKLTKLVLVWFAFDPWSLLP